MATWAIMLLCVGAALVGGVVVLGVMRYLAIRAFQRAMGWRW
jgi:hypothetical protein